MEKYNLQDFWVFGYASLMWHPGFSHEEDHPARLFGYHRSLCVSSVVYRGTRENPGLVFGLEAGGSCSGRAFRVHPDRVEEVCTYLRDREQVTMVYLEKYLPIRLLDSGGMQIRRVPAMCFVVDIDHPQYAGAMDNKTRRDILRRASGVSGDNLTYVRKTLEHLEAMNVHDRSLARLCRSLEPRQTRPWRNH